MYLATIIAPAYLVLTAIAAPAPAPLNLDLDSAIAPCPGLACYQYLEAEITIITREPQVISPPWDLTYVASPGSHGGRQETWTDVEW